jgi:WD40 repeat protein
MSPHAQHPNPYVGPRSFITGETLYGRDREVRDLLDLLIAERLILLFSPSGAGKSSLVQAGLIPRLKEEGFHVLPTVRVNLEPPAALRDQPGFNRYVFSALLSLEEDSPEEEHLSDAELAMMTMDEYLSRCPKGENVPDTIVLVFDQFEEVVTIDVTDREAKQEFFAQLGTALRERKRWALFAIREDYVGALDPYLRPIPTRLANRFRLELLGAPASRQAVQQPARAVGVDFTDVAAARLVDDLRRVRIQTPDGSVEEQLGLFVEPVQLQVVCYRLFDNLPSEDHKITLEHIESLGNVDTALADYYAERVKATVQETGVGERPIRDWFENQLITEQGIRGQVLMGPRQSGELDNRAINYLVNSHLVRSEKRGGATWFELAHDRLIDPIRKNNAAWLLENLSVMQRQAILWDSQDRPDSLLLSGQALSEAQEWAREHAAELTAVDNEFLEACADEANRLEAEEQARAAARLRRWNRVIIGFSALAIILACAAAFLGYGAFINQQLAESNQLVAESARATAVVAEATAQADKALAITAEAFAQSEKAAAQAAEATAQAERIRAEEAEQDALFQGYLARSGELAALSNNVLAQQRELAYLLSLEAFYAADTLQARNSLLTGLQLALNRTATPIEGAPPREAVAIRSVTLSTDGQRLAYGADFGQLRVWNIPTGNFIMTKSLGDQSINSVSFSPDAQVLVTGDDLGNIVFWELEGGTKLRDFNTTNAPIYSVAVSPDGKYLAHGGDGRTIYVWDYASSNPPQTLFPRGTNADVVSLAWSPDSQRLAAGSADGAVRIYDISTGELVSEFTEHEGGVNSVAWSQDGRWLAAGGLDNRGDLEQSLYLWDLDSEESIPLAGHTGDVTGVAFSPDGKVLASSDEQGTIVLWDVITRDKVEQLTNHTDAVTSLAFNRVGKPLLATGSLDRSINLYEIASQQPLGSLVSDGKGRLQALTFNDPDNLVMLGSQSGLASVWLSQVSTQAEQEVFSVSGEPSSATFREGGNWLVLGQNDGSVEVWESSGDGTYLESKTLETGRAPVDSLAIGPDGDTLAVGTCAGSQDRGGSCSPAVIQLWKISSAQLIATLESETDRVTSLDFTSDSMVIAAASRDGHIEFWFDVGGGDYQIAASLEFPRSGGFASLAFSPDDYLLAAGNNVGEIIMLDMGTLSSFGNAFIGGVVAVTSLAFSPDSLSLASGSQAGTVTLWDLNVEQWKVRACELAGRNLTQSEWDKYFPDYEYALTCEQFPAGE